MSNNKNLVDLVVDELRSSYQNPEETVTVFPFIDVPTTEQYYDISHIIPNIKLRIRWDGNIPQPTLSFSNILKKEKYNSDYTEIPKGIEVWMYPFLNDFKKESYKFLTKQILTLHNEYIYALTTYNNYQIIYNNTVIL